MATNEIYRLETFVDSTGRTIVVRTSIIGKRKIYLGKFEFNMKIKDQSGRIITQRIEHSFAVKAATIKEAFDVYDDQARTEMERIAPEMERKFLETIQRKNRKILPASVLDIRDIHKPNGNA
jgi:hypothetical protein